MKGLHHTLRVRWARVRTRGFTLVETLVAILILATAIAGPITIAAKGLFAALIASDQTTALFLAQDAIEYVRYVRDSNNLGGNDWLFDMDSCWSSNGTKSCYFDSTQAPYLAGTISACSGTCPVMNWDSTTGFYNYGTLSATNQQSKFTRTVTITTPVCNAAGTVCNASEMAVSARVSWYTGSLQHTFTVRENLLKWH